MLLVNLSLVCWHFLHIFAIDKDASFHITLIPRRWYNNEKMQDLYLDDQPYVINTGEAQSEGNLPCLTLFPMYHINKIHGHDVFGPEVRHTVQKRCDYDETFNFVQKAVRFAVESGGESFYYFKKSLNDWFSEEQKLAHIKDNIDKENFDPNQVGNPIERRQKGRPPVKRFKSSVEHVKSKKPQNKCGKCGAIGYYTPTCKK
jgi:hypothetical protein